MKSNARTLTVDSIKTINLSEIRGGNIGTAAGFALTLIFNEEVAVELELTITGLGKNWQLISAGGF
jgi:hypothetical protein